MKFNVRLVFRIAFQVLVTLDLHVWDLAGSIFIKSPKKCYQNKNVQNHTSQIVLPHRITSTLLYLLCWFSARYQYQIIHDNGSCHTFQQPK